MATLPETNSLRILSLDGGGMKGYTSLLILKRVLRAMKVEAKKEGIDLVDEPRPCDVFDLIVGTSTGGLIAIMLGRLHMTVDKCIEQYENLGKRVFGKTQWAGQTGRFVKGMFNSPFYDIEVLQKAVQSVLGLPEIGLQKDEDFKETAPLCKTVVCVTRSKTAAPDVLRNYESEHSTQASYRCMIWEAASATAAAPLYFKAVKFQTGGEIWRDGGLRRNNPINVALQQLELETEWKGKHIGCVLSLGTGAPKIQEVSDNLAKFLKGSVDMMTDSEDIAEAFAASTIGQDLARSRRFFRFSVTQGMDDLRMDEYEKTEHMKALTNYYLSKVGNGNEVERCAKSLLLPDQNWQERPTERLELLPYQNCIHYIHRETYSAELHRFFNPSIQGQRRFVLWGFAGLGKTQIALRFAHAVRNRLSVFWVRADSFANFLTDFSQIVVDQHDSLKDHKSPSQDLQSLSRSVTTRLEKNPTSWLLVLDNADNLDLFVETTEGRDTIRSYIPKTGRVLITTRNRLFQGRVTAAKDGLQVKPMDKEEARELFKKSITDDLAHQSSTEIVDELLGLLGNLPLAIAQAAANITDQQLPVHKYIPAYREKKDRMSLMKTPVLDLQTEDSRTIRQSILVTYEMSFEYLEQKYPASARCLNYFGFFHWQKVPEACIRALPEYGKLDEQSFRNTIKPLLHLSMIEEAWIPNGNEYSLHPVIHERISERMSLEAKMSYLNDSITMMSSTFPYCGGRLEREHYSKGQNLQSHALLQINLARDIGVQTEKLVLLTRLCALFLKISGMTSHSVNLATEAIVIGQGLLDSDSSLMINSHWDKMKCLWADAQYQEGYNASIATIKLWESARIHNKAIGDHEYILFRRDLLEYKSACCKFLGKIEEVKETEDELFVLWTVPDTSEWPDIDGSLRICLHSVDILRSQGRLREARVLNSHMLDSMDEQQQTAHRKLYIAIKSQKAGILKSMRDGSNAEPAGISDDDERAILTIFQEIFHGCRARLSIAGPLLWCSCNDLLDELRGKGEARQAADIQLSLLNEAVESNLQLEGQMLQAFNRYLNAGLDIIYLLHDTADARQGPPGSSIAKLFFQMTESAGTKSSSRWGIHFLFACSLLSETLGEFHRAEDILREALQDEDDRCIEGVVHHRLMSVIARQGRIDDARRHRETFLALIAPVEAIHGSLDDWLRKDKEDKALYDMAKDIVAGRRRQVSESWWTENRVDLNRLQLKYGLLVPKKAEGNPELYEGGSNLADTDRKGKSRELKDFVDKISKRPRLSSSP